MEIGNETSQSKAVSSLKRTLRRMLIAIIVIAILVTGFVGWSFYAAIYKWRSPATATVEIEQGTPVVAIAQMLSDQKVIRTPQIFSTFVRIRGLGAKLKAGEYEFPAGISADEVLTMLVKGEVKKYQLQIIEGWTIKDIAKYLSELTFLRDPAIPNDFLRLTGDKMFIGSLDFKDVSSLEGYLFPDTYEVLRPKTADEIIKRLVARFREIYTPECTALADRSGMTQQQIVTLASIIEKETGKAEERPTISSVFWNRLKQNMALQSDPTAIYGIPNFSGNLTREDLENGANPYNTYMHLGLPPGPICNPGKASIDAALQPAVTKYLYFVSKNDGTHIFSETLEEHQRAVAQYQLGRAFAATAPTEAPAGEVEPPPGVTAIPPLVPPKEGVPQAVAPQAAPGAVPALPVPPVVPPAVPPAAAPAVPPPAPSTIPPPSAVAPLPPSAAQGAAPQAIPGPSITPPALPPVAPIAQPTTPPVQPAVPTPPPAPPPTTPSAPAPLPPVAVPPTVPTTPPTAPLAPAPAPSPVPAPAAPPQPVQ